LLQLDTLQPTGEEEMVEMVEHAEEEAYEPFDEGCPPGCPPAASA
jgi:hypothetical protein